MKMLIDGIEKDETPEEISQREAEAERIESEYWLNTPYDDLVNAEIRKRYSESQEFSVLRQKEEKPEEHNAYFQFCEECKSFVKQKIALVRQKRTGAL